MSKRTADKVTIIVAWTTEGIVSIGPDRGADLGRRPEIKVGAVAKSALWLNAGTTDDVAKAEAFARTVDSFDRPARVFTYATTDRNARAKAEKAIMS